MFIELRSVPELLSRSGKKLRRAMKDSALASVALQRLLETGRVIELMKLVRCSIKTTSSRHNRR